MTNFDEYIKQGEPDKRKKSLIWQTAIGLQQTDGLKPSAYLIQTAIQNIEGDITFNEVKDRIDAYYKTQVNRQVDVGDRTEEAGINTEELPTKGGQKKVVRSGGQKARSGNLAGVFELIQKNPKITRKELSETLQINPSAVQKHIEKLKTEGIIVRTGSDKAGSWKILEKEAKKYDKYTD